REHAARQGWRDPADRRDQPADPGADRARLRIRRRALRLRQQDRVPEGERRVRAAASRGGRGIPRVPRETDRRVEGVVGQGDEEALGSEAVMTASKYQSFIESSSISGSNAPLIEALYEQFLENP